jgi:Lipopolysaccharide kinase (Kdo/WaaP) family
MSDTFWQRLVHGVRRLRQRPDWSAFVGPDWAEHIMDVAVTDRFHAKQGRSTGRWILERDGQRLGVYLKRHYRLPWWHGLLAMFRPGADWSPAFQEWTRIEWARAEGLPVPAAVAACEYLGPWGGLQSMLAVEELVGMLPLHEAIPLAAERLDGGTFSRWKRGLVSEMARLARALHQRRRFHKDFYLCHFYVPVDDTRRLPGWRGRVHLIDLHRLGHHPWTWRLWQMKDLAQLLYSSEIVGVNAHDRLRFWRLYLDRRTRGLSAQWLRWCIGIKWRNYQRHNAKRRQRLDASLCALPASAKR